LTEPAAVLAAGATDTHFALVETSEESTASPQAAVTFVDHSQDVLALNDSDDQAAMLADQTETDATEVPSDPQADFVESDDILDWTSADADGQSTVQLESVTMSIDVPESQPDSLMMSVDESPLDSLMMPIDTESKPDPVVIPMDNAESKTEDLDDKSAQEADNKQEAAFESASTWTEEEARFTAIDNEAFPAEESEPSTQFAAADTGFSFSPVDPEPSASGAGFSAPSVTHTEQSTNGASPPSDLSPATIEEIVRRVVAAMSESVVREVAWEVVPDCVERVIDQLTRESLSRRA